jgi:hypothetical protein
MNKDTPPEARSDIPEPKVLTEEQVFSLIAQFQFMLKHEVKNMKLEVVENMGAMLARRSGIDKELHDLSARVEILSKSVESFAGRLAAIEKAQEILPRKTGPLARARSLREPGPKTVPVPQAASPAPEKAHPVRLTKEGKPDRRGRPSGKGRYEAYNAAKRARKAGGTP